jgi:hypothetical protein
MLFFFQLPFSFTELLELAEYSDGAKEWKAGKSTITQLQNFSPTTFNIRIYLSKICLKSADLKQKRLPNLVSLSLYVIYVQQTPYC